MQTMKTTKRVQMQQKTIDKINKILTTILNTEVEDYRAIPVGTFVRFSYADHKDDIELLTRHKIVADAGDAYIII